MEILQQIGVNYTAFLQGAIFVLTLLILSQFVFKNFVGLVSQREEQTKGGEEAAIEFQKQTSELATKFELKARELNGEIKTIFDAYREEANKEYQQIVLSARGESQKILDETRSKINIEINSTKDKLTKEIPAIAQAITKKLLTGDR